MIVSVCADKGAPGVSTLATVLGLVWPAERVVLEADVSGADLPFRLKHADGDRFLDPQPSVLALAADVRGALPAGGLARYAQPTTLGVPVVPGALSMEAFTPMARLWPRVAEAAAGWGGTVITDLGRLQPGDAAAPLARASTAVLLLARPDLEGLYHLRDRVAELAGAVGDPSRDRNALAVVVRARAGAAGKAAVAQVRAVLESAGSPVPVLGLVAEDPTAVAALRDGQLTRRLLGSGLIRSTRSLTETLLGWWPQLAASSDRAAASASAPDTSASEPAAPEPGAQAPAAPVGAATPDAAPTRASPPAGLRHPTQAGQVSA